MDVSQGNGTKAEGNTAVSPQRAAILMLMAAAFLWGTGNVANKTVLQDLDPIAAVTARNVVAVIALLPFAIRDLIVVPSLAQWVKSAAVPSVFFAIAVMLQQWGYQQASVTNASFLVNADCIFTPVIALVVLREPLQICVAIAAILTVVGAFLMTGTGPDFSNANMGDLACLLSAVFYAGWLVALSRHATSHGHPLATICLHCASTLVVATTLLLFFTPDQPGTLEGAMPEILYLGLFSTALAFGLTAAAQARVSASTVAVILAAESLFGTAGGMVMLGERPSALSMLGAALILVGIFIVARAPALPVVRQNAPHKNGAVL